ncbi:MAG TPA: DUF4383 domain-containing protein [Ktedonobacterales bacterium]|nr:DUF4383 domain-containing protein [Ktedonobacterales bacterium]
MNSIARVYSVVLGILLLVVGLLGWLPLATPGGKLLGIFGVNAPHNLAHLLTGLIGVGAGLALSDRSVRAYTILMSVLYGVLMIVGFAHISLLQQALALNLADTILHTGIFIFSLFICVVSFTEYDSLRRLQRLATLRRSQWLSAPTAATRAEHASNEAYAEFAPSRLAAPRQRTVTLSQPRGGVMSLPLAEFAAPDQRFAPPDSLEALQERLIWLEREMRSLRGALARQDALEQQQLQLRRELELLRAQLQAGQGSYPPGVSRQSDAPMQGVSPAPYSVDGAPKPSRWSAPSTSSVPPGYALSRRWQAPESPSQSSSPSRGSLSQQMPLPRYGPAADGGADENVGRVAEAQEAGDAKQAQWQSLDPRDSAQPDDNASGEPEPSSWRTRPW